MIYSSRSEKFETGRELAGQGRSEVFGILSHQPEETRQ